MAIALVGASGAFTSISSTSITPAFGQATTAGHLLVAWVGGNGAVTITVSGPTGWVQAIQATGTFDSVAVFYKPNCAAGETAPTFTLTGASIMRAMVAEFSGADTVSPLEKTGTQVVNTSPSSPQAVNASGADAAAGNLVLAAAHWRGTAAIVTFTDTLNNGATATNHHDDGGTSDNRHESYAAYGITTSNGAADQNSTTFNQPATSVVQVIASFKTPGGGAVDQNPLRYAYGSN